MHTRCVTAGGCTGDIDCPCSCVDCRKAIGHELKTLRDQIGKLAKSVTDLDKLKEALKDTGGGGRTGSAV